MFSGDSGAGHQVLERMRQSAEKILYVQIVCRTLILYDRIFFEKSAKTAPHVVTVLQKDEEVQPERSAGQFLFGQDPVMIRVTLHGDIHRTLERRMPEMLWIAGRLRMRGGMLFVLQLFTRPVDGLILCMG